MGEPPKYKRRTWDECVAIALKQFDAQAREHLTFNEYEHCLTKACLCSGPAPGGWSNRLGFDPDARLHYEVRIQDWAESEALGSPAPRCWVRILVSRDRDSELCEVWWPLPAPQIAKPEQVVASDEEAEPGAAADPPRTLLSGTS